MKLFVILAGLCMMSITINAQTSSGSPHSQWRGLESRLDSIQEEFSKSVDSLNQAYRSPLAHLDSSRSALQKKLDTLYSNTIESSRIRNAIDSLNQLTTETITRFSNKLETLKSKTIGELNQKINAMGLPPDLTKKTSALSNEIEKFSFSSDDIGARQFLPPGDSPTNLKNLNLDTTFPPLAGEKDLGGEVSKDLSIPAAITAHGGEIQQLAKADPDAINNLAQTAEQKTAELSGLNNLQKEAGVLDEYKTEITSIKDPSALKEQGVEQLQQAAMDHFAGKEQVLQEAMDKVSKYKEKYESLSSLTDVPLKRPNEMRGKPFIERIVPAFMIQMSKEGDNFLVDFNPYVGYRFTGKFTAGPGWNQRIGYDTKSNTVTSQPRIYGPRFFADYNLWKGFFPRVEVEVMNAMVAPPDQPSRMDLGTREWVWGVFFGVKKEYRFIKNVKGTALVMTRLFDPDHKSPYADVLNVRFGFEFPMKKKLKQTRN